MSKGVGKEKEKEKQTELLESRYSKRYLYICVGIYVCVYVYNIRGASAKVSFLSANKASL